MIIKVCGIKTEGNIQCLSKAPIDMIGLNFYQPSVRYISNDIDTSIFEVLPKSIKKVGVFVNETKPNILKIAAKYKLDYVQLHGDENREFCLEISKSIPIIKVFRIDDGFNFDRVVDFDFSAYYLFDTKTINYGGSGRKFDWSVLKSYTNNIPFLLSGGIGPDDADQILSIDHSSFKGVDINSKFEKTPGIKDENLVLPFIKKLKVR